MDAGVNAQEFVGVIDSLKDGGVEGVGIVALDAPKAAAVSMEAVVSDILQSRKREPGGLKQTAASRLAAACGWPWPPLLLVPSAACRSAAEQPRVMMSISLGGPPGPKTGGMQMIGGQQISRLRSRRSHQRRSRRSTHRRLTTPKMVLPDPKQKPRTPPKPTVRLRIRRARLRGRGFETQVGTRASRPAPKDRASDCRVAAAGAMVSELEVRFLLPVNISSTWGSHPEELESESAGDGPGDDEIHDPAKRTDHRHRGG